MVGLRLGACSPSLNTYLYTLYLCSSLTHPHSFLTSFAMDPNENYEYDPNQALYQDADGRWRPFVTQPRQHTQMASQQSAAPLQVSRAPLYAMLMCITDHHPIKAGP